VSDYPRRLRAENINTEAYWEQTWIAESHKRRVSPDRFAHMALMLNRDESVLDVAGGLGEFLIWLRAGGFTGELAHVDQSEFACARARMSGFQSRKGSIYALPFGNREVDAVVLGEVIEHADAPADAVREAVRVARRVVIVSTPHLMAISDDPEHVWAWDLDSVQTLLTGAMPGGRFRAVMANGNKVVVASVTRE